MNPLIAKIAGKDGAPCPGSKERSKGKGRGMGVGGGKGPVGVPAGMKKESAVVALLEKVAKKNWIEDATKNKGGLHKSLGIAQDKKIPKSKIRAAAKKKGKVGKQARLAATLEKLGIAKEAAGGKPGIMSRLKAGVGKAGKYAKWGGIGAGVYLALKALEGAKEAREEATHRW